MMAQYDRSGKEAVKALALVVALFSVPAFVADYSPWPGRESACIASEWLEVSQQGDL
jgi:hypothetical protein